jgi:hypothetical protein
MHSGEYPDAPGEVKPVWSDHCGVAGGFLPRTAAFSLDLIRARRHPAEHLNGLTFDAG